jgi:hypothetical protein
MQKRILAHHLQINIKHIKAARCSKGKTFSYGNYTGRRNYLTRLTNENF